MSAHQVGKPEADFRPPRQLFPGRRGSYEGGAITGSFGSRWVPAFPHARRSVIRAAGADAESRGIPTCQGDRRAKAEPKWRTVKAFCRAALRFRVAAGKIAVLVQVADWSFAPILESRSSLHRLARITYNHHNQQCTTCGTPAPGLTPFRAAAGSVPKPQSKTVSVLVIQKSTGH